VRVRTLCFREVLLACALAEKNQFGFFATSDVRSPLEVIAGRHLAIPAFSKHMSKFLEPERGPCLIRRGNERNYLYRFADPILQPYVVLDGLSTGLISDEVLSEFVAADDGDVDSDADDDAPLGSPDELEGQDRLF
jgi:hypothetical protein